MIDSALLPWVVRLASFFYIRFQILKSGRTPFEQLKMKKYDYPMVEPFERVLARNRDNGETLETLFSMLG